MNIKIDENYIPRRKEFVRPQGYVEKRGRPPGPSKQIVNGRNSFINLDSDDDSKARLSSGGPKRNIRQEMQEMKKID